MVFSSYLLLLLLVLVLLLLLLLVLVLLLLLVLRPYGFTVLRFSLLCGFLLVSQLTWFSASLFRPP